MDAVILVGGEGTRLRPLTYWRPKPVLPVVDRPFLAFQFAQLRAAGVERTILSCGYLPDAIEAEFGHDGGRWIDGMRVEYAVEPEPLGTAGAIRFAAAGRVSEPFLVLNGDVLSDYDLGAFVARHHATGARATIALAPVEDPSRYGLVRVEDDGRVRGFLEKPKPEEIDTNLINAGVYLLDPDVLDLIPAGRAVSIEREVFPLLVGKGLYAMPQQGYWIDIGTPASYLAAHVDVLAGTAGSPFAARLERDGVVIEDGAEVHPEATVLGPSWIGRGAYVAAGAVVEAAAIGPGARVETGAQVRRSVLHPGACVGPGSVVEGSVVGAGATLGEGCALDGLAMVGAAMAVAAGTILRAGATV